MSKAVAVQMKADAKGTPAEKAGTSMSLKARADVIEQGFFDEKAEWNYARNVEVRRQHTGCAVRRCSFCRCKSSHAMAFCNC